jgi:hypothetical protein
MKNLIIDLEKHFPPAFHLFEPCDYFSPFIPLDQFKELQVIPDKKYCEDRYGIDVIEDWSLLENEYDMVVFIWPVHTFNDMPYTPNTSERREYFKMIYDKLSNIKINRVIYLDDTDRAVVRGGLMWLRENNMKCDFVFKREYRKDWIDEYDDDVFPFPFIVYGKPNAPWTLYEERIKIIPENRIPSCFWAGTAIYRTREPYPDEYCNRLEILQKIHPYLLTANNLSNADFIKAISSFKYFLNLNGTGHLCKRFFEGLSTNSLMLMQRTDLVFPFEDGDYFSEETLFSTAEEFVEKYTLLQKDEFLYQKCLLNQIYIVDKYFNYKWIKNYIESKYSL